MVTRQLYFLIFTILFTLLISPKPTFASSESARQKTAGFSANLASAQSNIEYDARVRVLEKYLEKYNSPLAPSAKTFVNEADKYNLDWKLVAAISGVESTFGHQIPYNSYNAWGWGIYGDNTYGFESFDAGIKTISKSLRENYINSWGAKDVYQIGRFYAASPTWAQRVDYFMRQIEKYQADNPANTLSLSI